MFLLRGEFEDAPVGSGDLGGVSALVQQADIHKPVRRLVFDMVFKAAFGGGQDFQRVAFKGLRGLPMTVGTDGIVMDGSVVVILKDDAHDSLGGFVEENLRFLRGAAGQHQRAEQQCDEQLFHVQSFLKNSMNSTAAPKMVTAMDR